MCGITGIVRFDGAPVREDILEAMTASLAHRGPDGWGMKRQDCVGLGHRRLAIIDPAGGRQPLCNEDGRIWITFNGEIYNYRELRRDLEERGHLFHTNSDTEVIVHAYEQWGKACVERFRGMFAFALADFRASELFLARDHLGIKPLYYLADPRFLAIASELQAFRYLPNHALTLDLQAVDEYLWLQYIPAPGTVFREVRKLPPAHRMVVGFDGLTTGPEEYWRLEFRPDLHRSEADWVESLEEVLKDSVRAHLVSDVPFGAFLSGGVDSSAIVAYMSQLLNRPVKTFTIGFSEEEFSELAYAQQASKRWKTEHDFEIVEPDALAILPELVRHHGEPFGDNSALPTYYLSRLARKHVPMVLSGDGGDELFGGYDSYVNWMKWLTHSASHRWKNRLRPLAEAMFPGRYPRNEPTLENWLAFIQYLSRPQRSALWRPEYRFQAAGDLDVFKREFERTDGYPPVSKVRYMDIKTYLPNDILHKVDVASMTHGLEVRTPLVDIRVMEFAATLPESQCISRRNGSFSGKTLLKKVLRHYYPEEELERPKMGFAIPLKRWFGPDGALRQTVQERLLGEGSPLRDLFVKQQIEQIVERNWSGPIWLLLVLDEWLRQNKAKVTW
ncbi:MAG TPA: asparagine synthase (glutamine-hydrolyzing) [Syntrophales bacterium]|nr:asparagine synthase (glutamine-hydrolyzing) [Syntrophales bacterium]